MIKKLLFLPLLFVATLVTGCGGNAVAIKPDAVSSVKTIALLEVPAPQYRLINLGSPIPLATVVIDKTTGAEKSVQTAVDNHGYAFNQKLTDELTAQLEKSGFKVIHINASRSELKLMKDYSTIDAQGADAILDVVAQSAGYVTEHYIFSPEWRPESSTVAAMYSPKNNEVIYEETIMYGYHNPLNTATDLDAPKEFFFKNQEAVFEAGEETLLAGLDDAAKSIASEIASRLRSN